MVKISEVIENSIARIEKMKNQLGDDELKSVDLLDEDGQLSFFQWMYEMEKIIDHFFRVLWVKLKDKMHISRIVLVTKKYHSIVRECLDEWSEFITHSNILCLFWCSGTFNSQRIQFGEIIGKFHFGIICYEFFLRSLVDREFIENLFNITSSSPILSEFHNGCEFKQQYPQWGIERGLYPLKQNPIYENYADQPIMNYTHSQIIESIFYVQKKWRSLVPTSSLLQYIEILELRVAFICTFPQNINVLDIVKGRKKVNDEIHLDHSIYDDFDDDVYVIDNPLPSEDVVFMTDQINQGDQEHEQNRKDEKIQKIIEEEKIKQSKKQINVEEVLFFDSSDEEEEDDDVHIERKEPSESTTTTITDDYNNDKIQHYGNMRIFAVDKNTIKKLSFFFINSTIILNRCFILSTIVEKCGDQYDDGDDDENIIFKTDTVFPLGIEYDEEKMKNLMDYLLDFVEKGKKGRFENLYKNEAEKHLVPPSAGFYVRVTHTNALQNDNKGILREFFGTKLFSQMSSKLHQQRASDILRFKDSFDDFVIYTAQKYIVLTIFDNVLTNHPYLKCGGMYDNLYYGKLEEIEYPIKFLEKMQNNEQTFIGEIMGDIVVHHNGVIYPFSDIFSAIYFYIRIHEKTKTSSKLSRLHLEFFKKQDQ